MDWLPPRGEIDPREGFNCTDAFQFHLVAFCSIVMKQSYKTK